MGGLWRRIFGQGDTRVIFEDEVDRPGGFEKDNRSVLGVGGLNGGRGENEWLWVGTGFCGPADEFPASRLDPGFGSIF